jgi:hypothetical protein
MFTKMYNLLFSDTVVQDDYLEQQADQELERLANDLKQKRAVAIDYLGDKWILKGGDYVRSNLVLGKK